MAGNGVWALAGLLISVLSASPQARAGEVLRFKQATINASSFSVSPGLSQGPLAEPATSSTRYFVVQFESRITDADHAMFVSAGAQAMRYVPDDALIVRATLASARAFMSAPGVRAVIPYDVRFRLSPEIHPNVFTARQAERVLVRVFAEDETPAITAQLATLPGVRVIEASGASIVLESPVQRLIQVASLEGVEWVQEMPEFVPMHAELLDENAPPAAPAPAGDYSDLDGFESGTKVMKFDAAWARGFSGQGQIGSMADTGMDTGNVATVAADFRGRVKSGYSFGLYAQSWNDPMGHGTHVAGSVMSDGAISGGKIRGASPAAKFVAQGMWSPMLNNLTVPPRLADMFSKAKADGATMHTNSWGSPRNPGAYDGMAQQVDEYAYRNQDLLILFAAGNSGVDANKDGRIDAGSVGSPGTAKNCLTVGASKNLVSRGGIQKMMSELRNGRENWGAEPIASSRLSDNVDGLAAFSSRGPTLDGRTKPEIVAPGTNVLSNRSRENGAQPLWGAYNEDYVWSGGTSMSTPLVAGAALVTRQYLVESKGIAQPSAALVKAALIHTAFDMFPGQFGSVGRERGQELLTRRPTTDAGYGRVDMDRATSLEAAHLIDERTGVAVGETKSYRARADRPSALTATLVWMDAPAADAAAKALVNDLDLTLVDSSGRETALRDSLNNVEMIEIQIPAGDYEVRVKGANVPQGIAGKQPFALIVTARAVPGVRR